jgi:mannuronan 5-epimerase
LTNTWQNDLHRRSSQLAAVATLLFLACLFLTLTFGLTQPTNLLKGFATVPRPPYVTALDPVRAVETGLPFVAAAKAATPSASVRVLEVTGDAVSMVVAGALVRSVNCPNLELATITSRVDNPAWIQETSSGVFLLRTALVFGPGTHVSFVAPSVRTIDLANDPDVVLGFQGASAIFNGVTVTAPSGTRSTPMHPHFRPFVEALATNLHIASSSFVNLGWDWNAAYGLSFMRGSSGVVTDSTFKDNFIGVYTADSSDIVFDDDRFNSNNLYGLDPHTYSSHLTITHNVADRNAAHGIIFSNHVTNSVVTDNVSSHNGENGIMMDKYSNDNVLRNNTVTHNHGDGIVLSNSSDNKVVGNTLTHNRLGINVYGQLTTGPIVSDNTIAHNVGAAEGISLNNTNTVYLDNSAGSSPPPKWHIILNYGLWPITILLIALSCIFRIGERRRLPNSSSSM